MKFLKSALTALILGAGVFCSADAVDDFFRSSPVGGYEKLPAEKVFPQGRKFPFSFYSTGGGTEKRREDLLPAAVREADQKEIIDAGATMIGPQYELNEMSLDTAKKYGVLQVYTIFPKLMIDGKERIVDRAYFREMAAGKHVYDEVKLREAVAREVKAVAHRPEIAWWDVTPEELRFWYRHERNYLKLACETIRANDPQKRPVFMYEPGHRGGSALAKMLTWQDLCIKGTYVNYSGHKKNRCWVRYSVEQQVRAVELAAKKDASRKRHVIALTEMFQNPPKEEFGRIPAWVQHDVYASLIAGAKGVLVFSASRRPNFQARKPYLDAYLKVCRQLTGKLNLGQIFLFGERKSDMSCGVMEGPEEISCRGGKKEISYEPVAMASYGWQGKRYVFLANSAEEEVQVAVGGMPYSSQIAVRNLLENEKEFIAPEGEFSVTLAPLQTAVFEIFRKK